jgi:AGZA family xanthine/uracil permease-like MFS transporter
VTTYVESSAGVAEGGRTGLTSVVVAILFGAAAFFAPLATAVPPEATAAALIVVGFIMMSVVRDIELSDAARALPAFLAILVIPLTMSISRGIGTAFITYAVLHWIGGRGREVPPAVWVLSVLFGASFVMEGAV